MAFINSSNPNVVEDLLVRAILQAVIFVATGTVLVCSLYKVAQDSSFSWHFLRAMRIAMGLFLGFLFVDVAASTTHYAALYGNTVYTVWVREVSLAGNYIYAIATLFEGAAHAALFAMLFKLCKGVLDTSLARESFDGCFMKPAGTMLRMVTATALVLIATAVSAVEIACLVRQGMLNDAAEEAYKDKLAGKDMSLETAIEFINGYGDAGKLYLLARRLNAALQCAFLIVALGVIAGAVNVWKRSRAESPVHKSRKYSNWVLGASLLWLIRNVWMVVRTMYITDITEVISTNKFVSHYAIIDVIMNAIPTFFVFIICYALSIKGRSKSADGEATLREDETLMKQPTMYEPMQQHRGYEPVKPADGRVQEREGNMPGYAFRQFWD
ncbi:hypothetical protein CSOJ01_11368 [Colletotrichum sojae]|uniref:Uncharacterized protein n=1 Tax=Colletotrichum sojae TaxID=2175907 RepID=A0A8H6IXV6_9PEZI|nr:hypothetical protein CSOJ01_11368 [Colletotrichum sojae]